MKPQANQLTIANATEFCKELLWWIEGEIEYEIDFSDVIYLDLSAVQLLICAKRYAALKNKTIKIINVSDEALSVFSITGTRQVLGV